MENRIRSNRPTPGERWLGSAPLTSSKLTRSKSLEVIPKESARYKKHPHLSSEPFVVFPTVIQHPVRPNTYKHKVAKPNSTRHGIVVEV